MEYKGDLYAKLGNDSYCKLLQNTDDWEKLENRVKELEAQLSSSLLPTKEVDAGELFDKEADCFRNLTTKKAMSREKFIELFNQSPYLGWIDLKIEKPEKEKFVLLCNAHWTGVGRRLEQVDEHEPEYADEIGEYIDGITHWMPLPAKPPIHQTGNGSI